MDFLLRVPASRVENGVTGTTLDNLYRAKALVFGVEFALFPVLSHRRGGEVVG